MPWRTYYDIENGTSSARIADVFKLADALSLTVFDLLEPILELTPERQLTDAVWRNELLNAVVREARQYSEAVTDDRVLAALASLTVIAKKAPEFVPILSWQLGAMAQAAAEPLADRIRGLQYEADRRARESVRTAKKSTTRASGGKYEASR